MPAYTPNDLERASAACTGKPALQQELVTLLQRSPTPTHDDLIAFIAHAEQPADRGDVSWGPISMSKDNVESLQRLGLDALGMVAKEVHRRTFAEPEPSPMTTAKTPRSPLALLITGLIMSVVIVFAYTLVSKIPNDPSPTAGLVPDHISPTASPPTPPLTSDVCNESIGSVVAHMPLMGAMNPSTNNPACEPSVGAKVAGSAAKAVLFAIF